MQRATRTLRRRNRSRNPSNPTHHSGFAGIEFSRNQVPIDAGTGRNPVRPGACSWQAALAQHSPRPACADRRSGLSTRRLWVLSGECARQILSPVLLSPQTGQSVVRAGFVT